MAQTQDRRSEGKNSDSKQAEYNRNLRSTRKALGVCVTCGSENLKNRSQCYACVDEAAETNKRSNFRTFLKNNGVELEDAIELFGDKPKYQRIKKAFVAALPKIKVH